MTDQDPKTGRFVKGNHASPGRKPRATEQEYVDAVSEVIPLVRWHKILEVHARRAERGDLQAFIALAKYIAPIVERKDVTSLGEKINVLEIVKDYGNEPPTD